MSRNFLRDPKWVGVVINKIMKCNFFKSKELRYTELKQLVFYVNYSVVLAKRANLFL